MGLCREFWIRRLDPKAEDVSLGGVTAIYSTTTTWSPKRSQHRRDQGQEVDKNSLSFEKIRGFPCGSAGKESARNAGDLGLIPGLGRSPGERKGYPLQYSGLENPMDYTVHWGLKETEQLSLFEKINLGAVQTAD